MTTAPIIGGGAPLSAQDDTVPAAVREAALALHRALHATSAEHPEFLWGLFEETWQDLDYLAGLEGTPEATYPEGRA